jgi:hypothetical protein
VIEIKTTFTDHAPNKKKKKKKGKIKTAIMLDKTLREIEVKTNELA